ncbi:cob(I)yrinic acid a,c-diamide adenosyltransferase [Desulfitobacterium sp. PCE1]|uniref:cob(I)yrinic acid a,c-diamide adenosyltransferase n=1 Tax=Desulfitobacterium sp. PCE1 TaxID=146907 RepID=UPI000367BE90|nr:cob(I)yrinic acid a,c-diamide adenosyltransferase [Desulfitobacterium sp. PCE1]
MANLEKGLIQIYTGNNKGKTTAALGLALRAVGHGYHVFILQFMKGRQDYGELQGLKRLEPECRIEQYGSPGWVLKGQAKETDRREAHEGLERAREIIMSGEWDIVILDEIINALWFELIPEEKVMELLAQKPEHVEVIMTGRNASPQLIEKAHLVTEMVEIKHPYELGIQARKGIEY